MAKAGEQLLKISRWTNLSMI